ncbi:MAG: UDP-galactopyranose mutase [Sphaerochaetaceae bacterium]
MKKYDYVIVGSGLFGSTFAYEAARRGKTCLVLEKRDHIGGNIYTQERDGINIHLYGAHIFHTSNQMVWDYINQFAKFNNYINSPIANYHGQLYNLPFNMNTFYQMWRTITPSQVREKLKDQRVSIAEPKNLEEQALSLVGHDVYERLIKGYTQKQWGRPCTELPASIIKRIPLRFRFDNNYFNDTYQGIPIGGYTRIIEKLLRDVEVRLSVDFNNEQDAYERIANKILYTGALDAYFHQCYGPLDFRSEIFELKRYETDNYQGVAVMNYTDSDIPYTRSIEHKFFEFGEEKVTWVSYEYSVDYQVTQEPYYPINDEKNDALYERYHALAQKKDTLLLGGRLAEYKYYDMDKTILCALSLVEKEFG